MNKNAKEEILKHTDNRRVIYVDVTRLSIVDSGINIKGTLEEVLPLLDFEYNNESGNQKLDGTIWYKDGTWSDRSEYEGLEWWEHRICPALPDNLTNNN